MSHPADGADAATPLGSDDTALLGEILRVLPLGLAISTREGEQVYANVAAVLHGAPPAAGAAAGPRPSQAPRLIAPGEHTEHKLADRTIETRHHAVAIGDETYAVTMSLDITEQRRLEDALFRRVYFDEMTGLPNRSLIERSVNDLIRRDGASMPFALAFIDIDNFKYINDYYGHAVGDGLLAKFARRIDHAIRGSDMLARVGGDEFVLLLTPIGPVDDVAADIERLLRRLKEPFFIEGHEIFSSASIGISFYPWHGQDYDVLRINADSAMYKIKSVTKGGFKIFDPNVGHAATERMKLEQRLRLAIRDRRLCCAFQPKVDFRADTVVGLEVLLRWRDEEGVIHAPGDFVNLAVELGLMDEITLTVLDEIVGKIEWIDQTYGPETTISINVAAKQACDYRFMRIFADVLRDTGFASRFMVELTEEAFMIRSQFQSRILPMLRDIGARVSIDDFGVGYSSLSALADITADEIKVDRSFITAIHQRPRSQSILKAIESMSHALGMSVIVEGVETFEELAYLEAATRIRFAQGFYFAKPQVFEEFPTIATAPGGRQVQYARETVAPRSSPPRSAQRGAGRLP